MCTEEEGKEGDQTETIIHTSGHRHRRCFSLSRPLKIPPLCLSLRPFPSCSSRECHMALWAIYTCVVVGWMRRRAFTDCHGDKIPVHVLAYTHVVEAKQNTTFFLKKEEAKQCWYLVASSMDIHACIPSPSVLSLTCHSRIHTVHQTKPCSSVIDRGATRLAHASDFFSEPREPQQNRP